MAALNFPSSPTVGQIYNNWQWDGNKWTLIERQPANVPAGGIIMWSGSAASLPTGYVLCDGTNGTPDLRGRFIIGAGGAYSPNSFGGSTTSGATALTQAQLPPHKHDVPMLVVGGTYPADSKWPFQAQTPGYGRALDSTTYETTASGGSGDGHTHSVMPPYYALCFIMKT